MKRYSSVTIILYLLFSYQYARAQGCSDAGFCSLNNLKPEPSDSVNLFNNQIRFGAFGGLGAKGIFIFGHYNEFDRLIGKHVNVNVKVTSLAQTGNEVSVIGLGDVFVTAGVRLGKQIRFTNGIKIPLSDGNRLYNDAPLPMDYQSSLGTYDFISGISWFWNKWQFVAAYQQPITQNNNAYLNTFYPEDSPLRDFISTNNYIRKADVMFRAAYTSIRTSKRGLFSPGLLAVYHLGEDSYINENGSRTNIENSDGLTVNTNFYWDYELSEKHVFQLNAGVPVYARNFRPDGLTRNVILTAEFRVRF